MTATNRLKIARKELKLSQQEMAKKIDISQSYYSAIEKGKRPLSDKVYKILSDIFNINIEWLENGKGDMFLNGGKSNNLYTTNNYHKSNKNVIISSQFEHIATKILIDNGKNFPLLIRSLETYFDNLSKVLNLIHQYDRYLLKYLPTELHNKAIEANLSPEDLKEYADKLFSNYSPLAKALADINALFTKHIETLKPFDIDETLTKDSLKEAIQAVKDNQQSELQKLNSIYNLLTKHYPNL